MKNTQGDVPDKAALPGRARGAILCLVSILCGGLYVAWIVGLDRIDPTNTAWLHTDPAMNHLGWAFLRQDPEVRFPLTLTDRVGFPLTTSIAFLDPVPLLAVSLLPVSSVLPAEFQYLNLFACLSASLLFHLGYKLARLNTSSIAASAAAGVLFLTNSVFVWRLRGHAALTGQFFIVWAIYEYIKRLSPPCPIFTAEALPIASRSRRGLAILLGLNAVALSVTPYLCLMTLFLALAYVARLLAVDRRASRCVVLSMVAGGVGLLLVTWTMGYWGGDESSTGAGFGRFSANLNTFVNPLWFSNVLPALPILDEGQIEGAAYLGISGLVLACSVVLAGFRSRPWLRSSLPLLICSAGAFFVAVSNKVVFGSTVLFEVPLYGFEDLANVFRAAGRLSWIPFYVIYVLGIVALCHLLSGRKRTVALVALASLQLFELAPLRNWVSFSLSDEQGRAAPLSEQHWGALAGQHEHLVVLPAWQCGPEQTPGGANGHVTFGLFAVRYGLTINSYGSSRYGEEQLAFHCRTLPERLLQSGPSADTVYVVDQQWLQWFRTQASYQCRILDGFNVCTHA